MSIKVRRIQEEDLELIMQWRMDPDITKYMNTNPQLTLEGQKVWLSNIRNDETCMHWMIENDDIPVGVINLNDINWTAKTSSWGYYIGNKEERSLDLAISLEMSLYDFVFDVLEFKELHNEVFALNKGVVRLHLACGNRIIREEKGGIEKDGILYDITHMSITKEEWKQLQTRMRYEHINYGTCFISHHIRNDVVNIKDVGLIELLERGQK